MSDKTWFQKRFDKYQNDPEYLKEYIKLLEEEIDCLNEIIHQLPNKPVEHTAKPDA